VLLCVLDVLEDLWLWRAVAAGFIMSLEAAGDFGAAAVCGLSAHLHLPSHTSRSAAHHCKTEAIKCFIV